MFQFPFRPTFCPAAFFVSFRWLLAVGAIVGVALAAGSESAHADAPTVRLRVEWSNESPACLTGGVTLDGGSVSNPVSLGTGTSDVGTIWISSGALKFQRRSFSTEDGIEFSATGPADAILHLVIRPVGATESVEPIEIRLADLFHKPAAFDALGNRPRVVIRRAPGDALGLRFDRRHLVFDPQETFHAAIVLNLLEDRGAQEKTAKAHVRWKLYPQGGSRSIADGSTQVNATINSPRTTEVPLELRLPAEEGTYELRLSATGRGFDDVERQVQLVVLEPSAPPRSTPQIEKIVDAFDPIKGGSARRVSSFAGKKRFDTALGRLWKRNHNDQEASLKSDEPANWQAYRLRAGHVDRAHRLTIYPSRGSGGTSGTAQRPIGACVFEPDAQGGLRQISPDLRWNLSDGHETSLELAFWPHDREPIVLIHSLDELSAPAIDRIELSEIGEHLPLSGSLSPLDRAEFGHRLCGPYLSRPHLARNFGAPQAFDAETQRSYDDWQTFLVSGRRLVEALEMQGANALLLTVAAEGSGLYPSQRLEPTARFDSGMIGPSGRDPIRKDVLELLLRMFDRKELVLIPELQFTEPLPALERKLRERSPNLAGIRLVDSEGRGWAEVMGTGEPGVPWYNPLDERVQQAVIDVVRELAERYRDHPAFGGIACELNPRGYLQYPGIEWGYDLPTIERFAQSVKIRVPSGTDRESRRDRYEYLTTTVRREWLAWRAAELGRFHSRIAAAVAEAAPQARFLFTGSGLATDLTGRELSAGEMVRTTANPVQQLLLRGINFSQASLGERVTAMRPVWTDSIDDPLGKAALLTLNQSPGIDAAYRGNRSGTLLYSLPDESRIRNCGALFDLRSTELVLPSQAVSDETELRRRYAHALGSLDSQMIFEGGGMLPITISKSGAIRRAFSRLPGTTFQPLAAQTQPAIIRTARFDDATWLCLVNSTVLPAVGELVLACPAETVCVDLTTDQRVALHAAGPSRSRLEWELGPHAIWCCRISHSNAAVLDVKAVLPGPVLAGLGRQVDRLHSRMSVIAELSRTTVAPVANAGFEEAGSELAEVVGWDVPDAGEPNWDLDEVNPRSGRRSLRISADGSRTALVSPPLPLQGVPHATLSLWMRSNRSTARVELKLEGHKNDRGRPQRQVVEVGKNWRKYEFRATNLPASAVERPRLQVQPLDSCRLWIDDLELDVQKLSADDARQLTKTASAVRLAWEQGRYADCQRLLEGYWGRLLLEDEPAPAPQPITEERVGSRPRKSLRR